MFYLCLAFSLVWICHLAYLLAIDRQVRQMGRRMKARADAPPGPGVG
ncbi:MAG: hypothetical protein JSW27_07845 [Phycisphaerales bacterium]|nr:MAG: hypothetical protein JSW27_07845 [Phycisphaerales bacterium]